MLETDVSLCRCARRYALEKQFHAQGHGEYREITEEEFLKEVCGSQWVVIHFYHKEFFRCKVVDKHLREIAKKHLSCKWLTLDAEKAPFFVAKLGIQVSMRRSPSFGPRLSPQGGHWQPASRTCPPRRCFQR